MIARIRQREAAIFLASIRHCLRNLLRFSGRDSRALFWPYAFTLFCLMNVGGYYWMMFQMERLMHLARLHAEDGSNSLGPGPIVVHAPSVHPAAGEFQTIFVGVAIGMAIFIALIAAAVWRRLHDRGRTGAWGLLPIVFASISFAGMFQMMGSVPARGSVPAMFPLIFLSNLAYLGSALALVIMLAGRGTPGPNEFGPNPSAAEAE